jgi:hypothetical protein
MNSLFVCHSTGDSNALIATAKELIKKNSRHQIVFFIIGKAAIKQIEQLKEASFLNLNVKANFVFHIIEDSLIAKSESAALTENDFESIKTDLIQLIKKYEITNALVGTPSLNHASLPFQMAEYLTNHFKEDHLLIYNDYLFKEKAHGYWNMLDQDWAREITHLVPLPTAKNAITKINPFLRAEIVGHPAIDISLSEAPVNKKEIREALAVDEKQALIFISGSKNFSQDKDLLTSLFPLLEQASKESSFDFELRLGIHPGIADAKAYITEILSLINGFPTISQHIKLLVNPTSMDQLTLAKESRDTLLPTSLCSDDISHAADGLVSTSPATLFNQAVLQGKPAYCHEADKVSYLPSERAFQGKEKLPSFLFKLKKKETPKPMTRTEIGLAENESFVENMPKLLS